MTSFLKATMPVGTLILLTHCNSKQNSSPPFTDFTCEGGITGPVTADSGACTYVANSASFIPSMNAVGPLPTGVGGTVYTGIYYLVNSTFYGAAEAGVSSAGPQNSTMSLSPTSDPNVFVLNDVQVYTDLCETETADYSGNLFQVSPADGGMTWPQTCPPDPTNQDLIAGSYTSEVTDAGTFLSTYWAFYGTPPSAYNNANIFQLIVPYDSGTSTPDGG